MFSYFAHDCSVFDAPGRILVVNEQRWTMICDDLCIAPLLHSHLTPLTSAETPPRCTFMTMPIIVFSVKGVVCMSVFPSHPTHVVAEPR